MNEKPEVTRHSLLGMQVCVPLDYTDAQVEDFANMNNPTGIESRWTIRRQGDPALSGCDERVQCEQRTGFVHVMLNC